MNRSFFDRFGALIIFGAIFALFIGLIIYASRTEEVKQGHDVPMGTRRG
ncbi:hypothetical protein [Sphingomonas sp. ERG5]|nr:hypothetical protein [Sphingomonas sp. ERG5]